ncbi:hypothetical protein C8F01DRAFT_1084942 [Mycena amicta]|nr:hypothetical protein C8F01DRAFT_1084942 [Mycena amicta]
MNPAPYIAGGHTSMFAPEYLSSPGMFVHGPFSIDDILNDAVADALIGGRTSIFAPEYLSSPGMFVAEEHGLGFHGPSNYAGTTMSGFDLAGASTSSSHAPVTVGPNPYYGFGLGVSPSIQFTSARDACRNRGECPHCGRRNIGNGQWRLGVVSDKMVCIIKDFRV